MHNTSHSHDIIKSNQRHQKLRRSTDEWRSIITDYKTSGLTQRNFCQHRGIAYSSFTTWFLKLKKSSSGSVDHNANPALFVDVLSAKPLAEPDNEWDVELAFANGTILRLKQRQG